MLAQLNFSVVQPLVVQGLSLPEIHSCALVWRSQAAKLAFREEKSLSYLQTNVRASLASGG